MCGILGFNFKDESLGQKMTEALKVRGPDDGGIFVDESVTLGHRRLSIIDLSQLGHQPMANQDQSIVITYNGEIYNFKELRLELQKMGRTFVSQSDTEVILCGYQEWGNEIFKKLRGMWALAIYDKIKNKIILSRDFFGIKPLYYFFEGASFVFASEISAIKIFLYEKNINISLSDFAISSYFVLGYAPNPFTVFEKIKKIFPGEIVVFDLKEKKISSCDINPHTKNFGVGVNWDLEYSKPSLPDDFESVMSESVGRHLISDVPVGVFLSGGIDSTLIATMLKKLNANISAFTIRVMGKKDADFARKIADFAKLPQEEILLDEEKFEEFFDKVFDRLDEPIADTSLIPSSLVAEEASKKVKVVLTGEGGDELFGGYERYQNFREFSKVGSFYPKFFSRPESIFYLQYLKPILRRARLLYFGMSKDLLGGYLENTSIDSDFGKKEKVYKWLSEKTRDVSKIDFSFFDEKFYLPDNLLKKTDFSTMSYSIEGRVPFLDKSVYQFAKNLEAKYKFSDGGKKIIKDYLASNLPKELIFRKKEGFSLDPRIYIFPKHKPEIKEAIRFILDLKIDSLNIAALSRALNDNEYFEFILNKFPQTVFGWLAFYKTLKKYRL